MKTVAAVYSNIDIKQLDLFRRWSKSQGLKFRVKYRGPRRPGRIGQSTCLKKDALRFSAYTL
jgi:hypothetical protein